MSDLISRQAAIDALDVLCQEHRYRIPGKSKTYSQYNEAWQDALGRAKNAIGNLPSVQPEKRTKERTKTHACDLIDRQAAIDAVNTLTYPSSLVDVKRILVDLPSAQPERKRGRWLPDNRPGGGFWVCSECKFPSEAFAADVLYKFCPNCGAEMREGE